MKKYTLLAGYFITSTLNEILILFDANPIIVMVLIAVSISLFLIFIFKWMSDKYNVEEIKVWQAWVISISCFISLIIDIGYVEWFGIIINLLLCLLFTRIAYDQMKLNRLRKIAEIADEIINKYKDNNDKNV